MLKVLYEQKPPIFEKVAAILPAARSRGVYFTYGRAIFIPLPRLSRKFGEQFEPVSPWMMAHETVHADRQGADPAGWWDRYLADIEFRFSEELEAHRAEYAWWAGHPRGERRQMLRLIAQRLSSRLYGNLCTVHSAKQLIRETGAA